MNLRGLINQSVTIEVDSTPLETMALLAGLSVDELTAAMLAAVPSDAEIVAEVYSLAASAGLKTGTAAIQAALYQDDDAHDTCSLTACLNPLHPGPCKGWKGTLFDAAPGAFHALEKAKADKANATRVKKIQDLKAKGLPIPHKLLVEIKPKAHPHEGQTAKKASGGAHEAGKAVSEASGIHNSHPGKVTLGQAVKTVGPVKLGPKGKKPSVMSKGIAFVIAQEKVTPQYKLDKAAQITPEQWNTLNPPDKAIVRAELAKIKKDGFGPQQKKADELLAKLVEKPEPTAVEKAQASNADFQKQAAEAAKKAPLKLGDATPKAAKPEAPSGAAPPAKMTGVNVGKLIHKNGGSVDLVVGGKTVEVGFEGGGHEGKLTFVPALGTGGGSYNVTLKDGTVHHYGKGEPLTLGPKASKKIHDGLTAPAADNGGLKTEKAKAKLAEVLDKHKAPKETAAPKPVPEHLKHAVAMANGYAPGATWSKNHLAAYEKLSAEEFHSLHPGTQEKIVAELKKGETKFLDPKKVQATKDLLAKFGKGPSTPDVDKAPKPVASEKAVGFSTHLHDHNVTQAQAKDVAEKTHVSAHFLAAKQTAGLFSEDNPDSTHHKSDTHDAVEQFIDSQTAPYDDGNILGQPAVNDAVANAANALFALKHAQSVHAAKSKAFNKVSKTLANPDMQLSPIEKASLQHYQKHLLDHPMKTDTATMDTLQKDAAHAIDELHVQLQAAKKKANLPKPDDMSPTQLADRAKELLGPDADKKKFPIGAEGFNEAIAAGKQEAADEAGKYPTAVLDDPNVQAKYEALAQAAGEHAAAKATGEKFFQHLTDMHLKALTSKTDVNGNPLSPEDSKVITLHASQLEKAATPGAAIKLKAEQLDEAKAAFQAAADHAKANLKPAEPNKLTDYDTTLIGHVYRNAYAKAASKAVTYGLKTYSQQQEMKANADYPAFVQDLTSLKNLAGDLALAHAAEHTAELNVPANPDMGDLEAGPEHAAWLAAIAHRKNVESDFNVLHKSAQAKLDGLRAAVGLKKRALPKVDSPAVKSAAAEAAYYSSIGYSGPNYGKPTAGKNYLLAKVGPKLAVKHQTASEKKTEKLGAVAAPTASTAKIENKATGEPVKLNGTTSLIWHIPEPTQKQITADFKSMPKGKYLADPTSDIFDNLVNLAAAHSNKDNPLSVDQVLHIIDATHSKSLGVANSGMLHKKVTEWLGTAAGKEYAEKHSVPDAKAVKKLTGQVDLPPGVTLAPGEKVQKLAGPGAYDASVPTKAFHPHTSSEAEAEQAAYMKAQGLKWTAGQEKAMTAYTGNGPAAYDGINNWLRGKSGYDQVVKQYAVDIQSSMMPLREDTLLKRGTGWPPSIASYASHPQDLLGESFDDKGFVSTSVAGSGGHFSGKPLQLIIEAPKGTPAVYVNGISHYKGQENEMLLAAGTRFKVLSVEKTSGGHTLLRVRVVGDK